MVGPPLAGVQDPGVQVAPVGLPSGGMAGASIDHFLSSTFLVEGVLMMAVAVLGVASNTISVYHFANLKHQRAFHRLLLILAIMDNLYLVSTMQHH